MTKLERKILTLGGKRLKRAGQKAGREREIAEFARPRFGAGHRELELVRHGLGINAEMLNKNFIKERFGSVEKYLDERAAKGRDLRKSREYEGDVRDAVKDWLRGEYAGWLSKKVGLPKDEVEYALCNPKHFSKALSISKKEGFDFGGTVSVLRDGGARAADAFRLAKETGMKNPYDVASAMRLAEGDYKFAREILKVSGELKVPSHVAVSLASMRPEILEEVKALIRKGMAPVALVGTATMVNGDVAKFRKALELSEKEKIDPRTASRFISEARDIDAASRQTALRMIKKFDVKDPEEIREIVMWSIEMKEAGVEKKILESKRNREEIKNRIEHGLV